MEKYEMIYAISYTDKTYTFSKGAPPKNYNKADIKISKTKLIKNQIRIDPSLLEQMNKEYSSLYQIEKKNDPTYTVDKHRSLYYEKIYKRPCYL
jgi:hypothetical protein